MDAPPSHDDSAAYGLAADHPVFAAERPFLEIAEQIPEFGGAFLSETGELVAWLTNVTRAQTLLPVLVNEVRRGLPRSMPLPYDRISVRQARFSFQQLRDWRDRLTLPVVSTPGVSYIDLDERHNRVAIGFYDEAAQVALSRVVRASGVPLDAVELLHAGRIMPDIGSGISQASSTLQSMVRPVHGGTMFTFVSGTGLLSQSCTIGFNAIWNNQNVWVSNSHCTENERSVTSTTTYWQPTWVTDGYIGVEANDPRHTCAQGGWVCRRSDAAVIRHSSSSNIGLGLIARPAGPPSFGFTGWQGSLEIEGEFRIVNDDEVPLAGWYVEKVGSTTGWTSGQITHTCAHVPHHERGNWLLYCQFGANYSRGQGDSGAPVFSRFQQGDDRVRLFGIHHGYDLAQQVSWFSPMSGIRHDHGPLDARVPPPQLPPPPPPGLAVQITTPETDFVRPYETCLYTAVASHGTPPYTFTWFVNGSQVGSGSMYYHAAGGGPFTISVSVVDGAMTTANRMRQMTVDYAAPECIDM